MSRTDLETPGVVTQPVEQPGAAEAASPVDFTAAYREHFAENTDYMPALRYVRQPNHARTLAGILVGMVFAMIVALIFTPWVQNVPGSGRVIAFDPVERQQNIEAPVDGRIVKWHVVEGDQVEAGQLLVEISDNDPSIIERLSQERSAVANSINIARDRVRNIEDQIRNMEATRTNNITAMQSRVAMADDRIRAAQQTLESAEAALLAARLNNDRRKALFQRGGLVSTRDVELAQMEYDRAVAAVESARATLAAEQNSRKALDSDLSSIANDWRSRIDGARASLASASSEVQKQNAELQKVEVRVARQNTQTVQAPIQGTVLQVLRRQGGEFLKAGTPLAVIVPRATQPVVALYVSGNDAPLITPGRQVRLQFEGWPAIQFSGWPSVAIGTFGGRVLFVDATDDGKGNFRILVEPDPQDEDWPSQRFLRQGVRANGWVLLNQVPLWFELWRQFNAFPPVISVDEPGWDGSAKPIPKFEGSSK